VRFFDPEALTQVRRGKLPHWTQPDVTYFVTFRLADSLPATKLSALREERDLWFKSHPVPLSDADKNITDDSPADLNTGLTRDTANACLLSRALSQSSSKR
jgi:hypothetical protein